MKKKVRIAFLVFVAVFLTVSCRRRDYVCDCAANNKSFQNIFFNATEREARDLCDAAEVKFEPGNPGLQCELYEKQN
jgi:hypothetical protein